MSEFRNYRSKDGVYQGQTNGAIQENMIECPAPVDVLQKWQVGLTPL